MKHEQIQFLEHLGQRAWPPARIERLSGWRLGLDAGTTRRANSVLPSTWNSDSGTLQTGLSTVEACYREHNLRPCFKLTRAAQPRSLSEALTKRGYRDEGASQVLCATIGTLRLLEPTQNVAVRLTADPMDDWCHVAFADQIGTPAFAARRAIVERVEPAHRFAIAHIGDDAVGAALAVAERGWTCVTAVQTDPRFRRRGVARSLFAALIAWGAAIGQEKLYIQVELDNPPALTLYRALGFQPAYRYHYAVL